LKFEASRAGGTFTLCRTTPDARGNAACSYTWQAPGTYAVTATASVLDGTVTAPQTLTYTVGPTLTVRVNGQEVSSGVVVLVSDVLAVLSVCHVYLQIPVRQRLQELPLAISLAWKEGQCVLGC
jgi:hypothetical protein